jgi:uncharacterized protein
MTDVGTSKHVMRFIPAVIRWRLGILVLWSVAVVASCVVYLTHFRIDNSVAIWFLEEDSELADYNRHNATFGEREWTYVWLRGDSVFAPAFLRDLRLLGNLLKSLESVTRVVSLTEGEGGETKFGGGSAVAGELSDSDEAQAFRRLIRGSALSEGRLVPRANDQFTILAVQNANRVHSIDPYRIRLIDGIRAAIADYPTILDSGIVGTTVINAELNRAARRDMLVYYTLIAAVVLIGGGVTLGSWRDLVVLVSVVVGTVLPVLGAFGALELPFNLMTVMLPTLLVTVSVSYLIHFISEFHAKRRAQEACGCPLDVASAISATFAQLLLPGFWTSVTTAIGFASLTVSPVAPIRQIGMFAAFGISLAWLATITIAPTLLSLLWRGGGRAHRRDTAFREVKPLLGWLARPRPLMAAVVGGAMLTGVFGLVWLETDTNYVKFFRPGSEVRNDYAQLKELGLPSSYLTVTALLSGAELADPNRHLAMRRFEKSLLALPEVVDVQSLDGRVAELAAESGGELPMRSVQSLLAKAESGQLRGAGEFLSHDGVVLRLRVMTGAMSTRDIEAFRAGLEELAKSHPEEWDLKLTGTNVLWANMDEHVVSTQLLSIGITAVVLFVLLPLLFRSFLLGGLGFVVSFVPVLCTLGLMGWIGLPVNIATCILGGVVMGVAVDDTIYYLSRFRDSTLRGLSVGEAVRGATMTTGRAMMKTSLILTGGFLTMTASDFLPSVYFGAFFAFSILAALFADLVMLPALLRLMCRDLPNQK